jgi:FtsZ-interacting cell division protein ZipA
MASLPSLTIPGWLIVVGFLAIVILIVAGTLLSALRGRSSHSNPWGQAFSGARQRQREQRAQMDELHRAVAGLSNPNSEPKKPHE